MRSVPSAIAALLAALGALTYSVVSGAGRPGAVVGAFTLKKTVTLYARDGTTETRREIYRRSSDGSFRIVETNGKVIFRDRGFWQGRGFFHADYGAKTLWRDVTQKPDRGPLRALAPDVYTRDSLYVGTDTALGRSAYMLRVLNKAGGVDREDWFLPELGGAVTVRSRMYRTDGSLERTEDAYELDFSEPDPNLVRLPDFPAADPAPER